MVKEYAVLEKQNWKQNWWKEYDREGKMTRRTRGLGRGSTKRHKEEHAVDVPNIASLVQNSSSSQLSAVSLGYK